MRRHSGCPPPRCKGAAAQHRLELPRIGYVFIPVAHAIRCLHGAVPHPLAITQRARDGTRGVRTIQWLDELRFDEAWVGEHHSAGWETISSPEVFIAYAAAKTRSIRLGTGVVSLPYHNPYHVAERMVLLDQLTRGRVMLGVGPGALPSDAYQFVLEPRPQRPQMDESLGSSCVCWPAKR